MVAPQESYLVRIQNFDRKQQQEDLQAVEAAVNVVASEEVMKALDVACVFVG